MSCCGAACQAKTGGSRKKSCWSDKVFAAADGAGLGNGPRPASALVVTEPGRTNPAAVIRTAALAAPFATGATFAVTVVAMPATRAALTRAVVAVYLDNAVADVVGHLADVRRSGAGDRGRCREQARHG